jgi:hypothetical protein
MSNNSNPNQKNLFYAVDGMWFVAIEIRNSAIYLRDGLSS